MLRLMVLTFPFLVMAALFYAGYIITAKPFSRRDGDPVPAR